MKSTKDALLALSSNMFMESKRLETFANENVRDAHKLAEAGFYCCKAKCVKCYFCDLELEEWRIEDDPWKMHQEKSERCPLVCWRKNKRTMTLSDALQLQFEKQLFQIEREYDDRTCLYMKNQSKSLELLASEALKKKKNGSVTHL